MITKKEEMKKSSFPLGIDEEKIQKKLRVFSKRYKINYEKYKVDMVYLLNKKLIDTKEDITDLDCKEVCKYIAEKKIADEDWYTNYW